tara:strand:- start:991 stop:1263 length:273 start_codon:yes stop_codon:yes gene_type:complete
MLTKEKIAKNISYELNITKKDGLSFVNSFIDIIKLNSKNKAVKISNFGTFDMVATPKRMGRNPKTKESYIILPMTKLSFKPSNLIKKILN